MSYTVLNHIFFFSEEPKAVTHKLDYPLRDSLLLQIHSAIEAV
jgi:hypothetical protein